MKNLLQKRIKSVFEWSKLSKTEFSNQLNISRQHLNRVIAGTSKPGSEILEQIISTFPNIRANWLLSGDGSLLKHDDRSDVEEVNIIQEPRPEYVAAGTTNTAQKMNQHEIKKLIGSNEVIREFKVIGVSMQPSLYDGEIIYGTPVPKYDDIIDRHVYILETETRGMLIKRVKFNGDHDMFKLISDNKDYPSFSMYTSEVEMIYKFRAKMSFNLRDPNTTYKRLNDLEETVEQLMNRIYTLEEKIK